MQSLVLSLDQLVLLSVPYNASITSVANSVQHVMGPISTLFLSQDLQSSGVRYSLICFSQPIHDMEQFARQWEFTNEYTFQDPWCMENNHTCLWTSPQKVIDLACVKHVLPTATMHNGLVYVSATDERKWVDSHLHFWNVELERMQRLGFATMGTPSEFCHLMNRVASVLEQNNRALQQQHTSGQDLPQDTAPEEPPTMCCVDTQTDAHTSHYQNTQTDHPQTVAPMIAAQTQTDHPPQTFAVVAQAHLPEREKELQRKLVDRIKMNHAHRVQQMVKAQKTMQSELDQWKQKCSALQDQHSKLTKTYQAQVAAMKIDQQALADQCNLLEKQMVDRKRKSQQEWEKSTKDIQAKCKGLQGEVVKYKKEVEEYKVMYNAKQSELDHVRDEFKHIEKKTVTQKRVNDMILGKIDHVRKKLMEESNDPDCKTLDALVSNVCARMEFLRKERLDLLRVVKRSTKQPTYDQLEGLDDAFADEYLLQRKEVAASIFNVLQKTHEDANDQPSFHKAMEVELEPFEIVHPPLRLGHLHAAGIDIETCRLLKDAIQFYVMTNFHQVVDSMVQRIQLEGTKAFKEMEECVQTFMQKQEIPKNVHDKFQTVREAGVKQTIVGMKLGLKEMFDPDKTYTYTEIDRIVTTLFTLPMLGNSKARLKHSISFVAKKAALNAVFRDSYIGNIARTMKIHERAKTEGKVVGCINEAVLRSVWDQCVAALVHRQ